MLKISDSQNLALAEAMMDTFVTKSQAFLRENEPHWCEGKDDETLRAFVNETAALARARDIRKEINIQRLLIHRVRGELDAPPADLHHIRLSEDGVPENERIERYRKTLHGNGFVRITLDTDLEALRGAS